MANKTKKGNMDVESAEKALKNVFKEIQFANDVENKIGLQDLWYKKEKEYFAHCRSQLQDITDEDEQGKEDISLNIEFKEIHVEIKRQIDVLQRNFLVYNYTDADRVKCKKINDFLRRVLEEIEQFAKTLKRGKNGK